MPVPVCVAALYAKVIDPEIQIFYLKILFL